MTREKPVSPYTMFLALFFLAAGCTTAKVAYDWKDESYQRKPGRILIISLFEETAYRRLLEDELAGRLNSSGIETMRGYTIFPATTPPDHDEIKKKIREVGVDALLLIRLLDRKSAREEVLGSGYAPPLAYHDWPAYYGGYYSTYQPGYAPVLPPIYPPGFPPVDAPGYLVDVIYDRSEANLYDAVTGKLIWSAVTESRFQGDIRELIENYAKELAKALKKRNLTP